MKGSPDLGQADYSFIRKCTADIGHRIIHIVGYIH